MTDRLPAPPRHDPIVWIHADEGAWISPPLLVATRFQSRLRGLRPAPFGWGMLLGGRTVHGRGLICPIRVVPITRAGCAGPWRRLFPGGRLRLPEAVAILELADGVVPPAAGTSLQCVTRPTPRWTRARRSADGPSDGTAP